MTNRPLFKNGGGEDQDQFLTVLSREEVSQLALHLARHQEEDGAFALGPPANAAPPVWESRSWPIR